MQRFLLVFLLLMVISMNGFSQLSLDEFRNDQTKMYVKYAQYSGYQNDSIYAKLIYGSLFLGQLGTVYTYQIQTLDELLREREKGIKDEKIKKIVLEETVKFRDWERHLTDIFVKSYNSEEYLSRKRFDKDYYWLPDTAHFNWVLVNDYKTIENYKCQKAVIPLKNGEIVAWFTEQIPISSGPFYISGLPGLVLEYFNPERKSYYKVMQISSVDFPDQKFRDWLTGPIITHEKYSKLREENAKTFENLQRMIQRGKVNHDN